MFQYKATDFVVPGVGKAELVYTAAGGKEQRMQLFDFKEGGGVIMGMYNTDEVCHHIHNLLLWGLQDLGLAKKGRGGWGDIFHFFETPTIIL